MTKYDVTVATNRTWYRHVEVEATTAAEAAHLALDPARDEEHRDAADWEEGEGDGPYFVSELMDPDHDECFDIPRDSQEIHIYTDPLGQAAPALAKALQALMTNSHVDLGDLVYTVREREGQGWEGPAVKAWSDAVVAAKAALGEAGITVT